jgi:hypothetical protein
MMVPRALAALTAIVLVAPASALAQAPDAPVEVVIPTPPPPPLKSDEHRVAGKVLEVHRDRGLLTLDTDEGVVLVPASPVMVGAVRVGETVTVPRPEGDAASASPPLRYDTIPPR